MQASAIEDAVAMKGEAAFRLQKSDNATAVVNDEVEAAEAVAAAARLSIDAAATAEVSLAAARERFTLIVSVTFFFTFCSLLFYFDALFSINLAQDLLAVALGWFTVIVSTYCFFKQTLAAFVFVSLLSCHSFYVDALFSIDASLIFSISFLVSSHFSHCFHLIDRLTTGEFC
jgi:hypothetical protein